MYFDFKHFFQHQYHSFFNTEGTHMRLTWKRIQVLMVFYLFFPIVEFFTWIGFGLDEIFFPKYKELPVKQPVFVIGNYRSGTTFLHRLMAMDKKSFTAMAGWEIFIAPSITQRKFFRALVALDKVLGGHMVNAFDRFWQRYVQDNVDFHQLGVREPEEDEGILAHIWSGIIPWNLFPVMKDGVPEYATFDSSLSEKEKTRVMEFYKRCVQRHMFTHGESTHYLSKSPSFSGKVDALYKTFPDAKIVYLIRNPMQMVPSQINMWAFKWNVTLSPLDEYPYQDKVLEMIKYWYQHPLERLAEAPANSYKIVLFDDLTADPEGVVRELYEHFGFEMGPKFARKLHRTSARSIRRSQKVNNKRHVLAGMGLSTLRLIKEFPEVFKRFHFVSPERKQLKQQRKIHRLNARIQRKKQRALIKARNKSQRKRFRKTAAEEIV